MKLGMALVAAAVLTGGCGDDGETTATPSGASGAFDGIDPANLDAAGNVRLFAASSSAPNVFAVGLSGVLLGSLNELDGTSTCPKVVESGATTTYTGGCTDSEGNEWHGKATVVDDEATGEGSIAYDAFGFSEASPCKGASGANRFDFDGTLELDRTSDDTIAFTVAMKLSTTGVDPDSCATFGADSIYEYSGTFVELAPSNGGSGGGATGGAGGAGGSGGMGGATPNMDIDHSRWNGSGKIGNSLLGWVDATTEDELLDSSACSTEALSGTTTIQAGSDVAVVTYDGATDCDETSTVTWTYNGAAQGELTDIRCGFRPAPSIAPGGGLLAVFAAALAALLRRALGRR